MPSSRRLVVLRVARVLSLRRLLRHRGQLTQLSIHPLLLPPTCSKVVDDVDQRSSHPSRVTTADSLHRNSANARVKTLPPPTAMVTIPRTPTCCAVAVSIAAMTRMRKMMKKKEATIATASTKVTVITDTIIATAGARRPSRRPSVHSRTT